jgi:hypothetical protein
MSQTLQGRAECVDERVLAEEVKEAAGVDSNLRRVMEALQACNILNKKKCS